MTPELSLIGVAVAVLKPRLPEVYPGYLAQRIRNALRLPDPEGVITSVADIVRIGDGKDLIVATDFNGTHYRITVEVEPTPKLATVPATNTDSAPDIDGDGLGTDCERVRS